MLSDKEATERFTPTKEEQTALVLAGKCPHNKGWTYVGHARADFYECRLFRVEEWY
jgi:hypothetical protein